MQIEHVITLSYILNVYTRYFTLMTIYEFPVIKLKIGLFVIRGEKIFNTRIFIKMFVYILFSLTLFPYSYLILIFQVFSTISKFTPIVNIHSTLSPLFSIKTLIKRIFKITILYYILALHSNINTIIVHPSIKFNYQLTPRSSTSLNVPLTK